MKHNIIIISMFLTFFVGCKFDDNCETLKTNITKKISIAVKNVSYGLLTLPKLVKYQNQDYLIYCADYSWLYLLSVKEPTKFEKVKIPAGDIIDVIYINKDSIFLTYNPHENFQPNHIILIDNKGNIKKKISLFKYIPNRNVYIMGAFITQKNLINNRYIVFDFQPVINDVSLQTLLKPENKYPQIACYDLMKDTIFYNNDLFFPDLNKNINLSSHSKIIYISPSAEKHKVLIRYIYSPYVYEWDLIKQKTSKFLIKSQIIDSIYNYNNFVNAVFTEINHNNSFYFFYTLPLLDITKPYKPFTIVTDRNFNYVTESTEDLLFSSTLNSQYENYKISLENDFIIITYFDLKLEHCSKKQYFDYISKIKNDIVNKQRELPNTICKIVKSNRLDTTYDINLLLKNYYRLNDTNMTILIMYGDMGCSSCNESLLEFIAKNYIFFKNQKLYILLSSSQKFTSFLLHKYQLANYPYMLLDTIKLYNFFNSSKEYIPRIVKIKKMHKYFDKFYSINKQDSLEIELLNIAKN